MSVSHTVTLDDMLLYDHKHGYCLFWLHPTNTLEHQGGPDAGIETGNCIYVIDMCSNSSSVASHLV